MSTGASRVEANSIESLFEQHEDPLGIITVMAASHIDCHVYGPGEHPRLLPFAVCECMFVPHDPNRWIVY